MLSLSVVIPARNEAARLGACLQALADQREPADEIVVVDNASTDATGRIARRGGARVVDEPRPGIAAARAAGFDAATGQVLARIDADTLVSPCWAAAIRAAFADDPGLDALAGSTRQSHVPAWFAEATGVAYDAFCHVHRASFGAGPLLYGHNMAIRADAWRRIRDLVTDDDRVSEDVDVALAVLYRGGTVRVVHEVAVEADLVRSVRPAKLAHYLWRDELTRIKYRHLGRQPATT